MDDELVERCFLALMNDRDLGLPLGAHIQRHILKQRIRAIIPIVQADQRERDAGIAWTDADALNLLHGAGYACYSGVLVPPVDHTETSVEREAINYLCAEWDYGWRPAIRNQEHSHD